MLAPDLNLASHTDLPRGISVVSLNGNKDLRSRLKINTGTYVTSEERYQKGARLPNQDWRDVTEEECLLLTNQGDKDDNCQNVYLWSLPQTLLQHMEGFPQSITKFNDKETARGVYDTRKFRRGQALLLNLVTRAGVDISNKSFGHYISNPGLVVTSSDDNGTYVGLHMDSWFSASLENRDSGLPSRMCINLGPEDRYFLFMNLPLRALQQRVGSNIEDPIKFPGLYMNAFPDYPVFRLTIHPGEAYIAPTEILIHDATSLGKKYADATLVVMGNFDQKVLENILSETATW